jgi:hypothetical protein
VPRPQAGELIGRASRRCRAVPARPANPFCWVCSACNDKSVASRFRRQMVKGCRQRSRSDNTPCSIMGVGGGNRSLPMWRNEMLYAGTNSQVDEWKTSDTVWSISDEPPAIELLSAANTWPSYARLSPGRCSGFSAPLSVSTKRLGGWPSLQEGER